MKRLAWLGLVLASNYILLASGLGVGELGVQGMGNAGAFVARAEDASALFYNAAGLARLKSSEAALNFKMLSSKSYYSNPGQTSWDTEVAADPTPEFLLATKWRGFGVAVGATRAYFQESFWDDKDFPGRYLSNGSSFEADLYSAALAVPLGESFSLGMGVLLGKGKSEERLIIPRPLNQEGTLVYDVLETSTGSGDDMGYHLGLLYSPNRRYGAGLSYQSALELELTGERVYEIYTRENDIRAQNDFASHFTSGSAVRHLTLPARITVGAWLRTTVRTRVELDYAREDWSDNLGRTVEGRFEDAGGELVPWSKVSTVRVGADFQQLRALLWRIGLFSSDSALPSEIIDGSFPDYDRFGYAFGVSYTLARRYTLELATVYTQTRDRQVVNQEYNVDFNLTPILNSSGQTGQFETQRYAFNFGLRVKLD